MKKEQGMVADLDEIIGLLTDVKKEWFTKIPGVGVQLNKMQEEFQYYRESLDGPSSVMIMGRTGAGKSSFINALIDDPEFMKVGHSAYSETKQVQPVEHTTEDGAKLVFLDTRGGGEAGIPDSEALNQIQQAALTYNPRVVFILMPPDRAHWDEDLAFFTKAVQHIHKVRKSESLATEIVGIVTKIDTIIDPFDPNRQYDWKHASKKSEEKIADWCQRLKKSLEENLSEVDKEIDVFPICAKFGLNDDDEEIDLRWGLDEVLEWLGKHAPFDLLMKISELLKDGVRRNLAVDLVHRFSALAGIVGAIPIPFADAPIIAYLQYVLVRLIYSLSKNAEAATPNQYFALIGGTTQFIGKIAARQLVGALAELIPGWGSIVGGAANAAIAAGFTEAFGQAAVAYYFDGATVMDTLSSLKEVAASLRKDR